jgi:phosphopantetheine--protein transferase-like protein
VTKAIGRRILFPHICILPTRSNDPRPQLQFTDSTAEAVASIGITNAHVSVSHEKDYATAFVILESESEAPTKVIVDECR